jgi:hypothetical protein
MNTVQQKKLEIISNLSFVPVNRLDEIQRFIEYILYTTKAKKKKPISVRGNCKLFVSAISNSNFGRKSKKF